MKNSRKQILYLCADRGIALGGTKGASIHMREFVETLREAGYEVIVAASKEAEDSSYSPDYPVHILPDPIDLPSNKIFQLDVKDKQSLREMRDYNRNEIIERSLSHIYRESKFDLIYERYSLFATAGRLYSHTHNIPYVLEVNAPLVDEASKYRKLSLVKLAKSIEKFLFTNADHIVSVSKDLSDYIKNVAPETTVSVIPNGVSLNHFNTAIADSNLRNEISNSPDQDFIIGFVGSVKPWHGVDLLLESLSHLLKTDRSFSLCVVGNKNKNYQGQLETQCKELKLDDKVTFLGAVPYDNIPGIMKCMDVLVAPYPDVPNFYFSPLKVFEYMAAGKPIVASAIGQINEILTHKETALLVPPGDSEALSIALRQIKSDASLGKRLAQNSAAEVEEKHQWRHRIERITEIIESLKSNGRTQTGLIYADTI